MLIHSPLPCSCLPQVQAAVREYALSRALQLDPKCVPAWVALARLYAGKLRCTVTLLRCTALAGRQRNSGTGSRPYAGVLHLDGVVRLRFLPSLLPCRARRCRAGSVCTAACTQPRASSASHLGGHG